MQTIRTSVQILHWAVPPVMGLAGERPHDAPSGVSASVDETLEDEERDGNE